jgi:hypothetical protein
VLLHFEGPVGGSPKPNNETTGEKFNDVRKILSPSSAMVRSAIRACQGESPESPAGLPDQDYPETKKLGSTNSFATERGLGRHLENVARSNILTLFDALD